MANTYTQLYIQYVFSVKNRECFLQSNDNELQRYINGIIKNLKCTPLAINNMPDHIHIFVAQHPNISISELAQKIKNNSSRWLNNTNFNRQTGYGAFSYAQSQISAVFHYIQNEQIHHRQHSFEYEYKKLLNIFNIKFDKKYLFDFFAD